MSGTSVAAIVISSFRHKKEIFAIGGWTFFLHLYVTHPTAATFYGRRPHWSIDDLFLNWHCRKVCGYLVTTHNVCTPLASHILHNFISTFLTEIMEATVVDGANHFKSFQFLWVWNDFLVALTFASGTGEVALMSVKLASLVGQW
jgi:hypothetical protein